MPIFSRRRIQQMIDELRPLIGNSSEVNGLVRRLENIKPEQALGAEMELALLWGIKQVANLVIEPELPDKSKPEAYSEDLFEKQAYIEVTTLSDGNLSGERIMQRAAQKMVSFANQIKKGSGNYLYFEFHDRMYWEKDKFNRELCIGDDFELDETLKTKISNWLKINHMEQYNAIRFQNNNIDVTISRKPDSQRTGSNYFSRKPALAYDIENNPLFTRLKEKQKQLSDVPINSYKVIFLADGGSQLLRNINEEKDWHWHISGAEIIKHFLERSSIDIVCVFSPKKTRPFISRDSKLEWQYLTFVNYNRRIKNSFISMMLRNFVIPKGNLQVNIIKIEEIVKILPKPRFEGYQARSLQKQRSFNPKNNKWYNGTTISSYENEIKMKISARVLHELLAGKISQESFQKAISSNKDNFFNMWLEQGFSIRDISFEYGGIDKDDDYVKFTFEKDPSISPLK